MRHVSPALILAALLFTACGSPDTGTDRSHHVLSVFGDTLPEPSFDPETRDRLQASLATARAEFEANPGDLNAAIWLGRRTAYLWRYPESIDIYTRALRRHPEEPRLLRHRGHRYVSVRDFESAEADLELAASLTSGQPDRVERDGQPNDSGIPVSTLQTNIYYHLGLAQYLQGNFLEAATSFATCRSIAKYDDMKVAAADWEYMARRRAGLDAEADEVIAFVTPELELLENEVYQRRILMYQGQMAPDELLGVRSGDVALNLATQGYGVANWYLVEGDTARAVSIFRDILAGDYWPAFGYIAAEADLQRLGESL